MSDVNKKIFELLWEFFKKIDDIRQEDLCEKIKLTYHGNKDYYDIAFKFRNGNSKYEDCVIIYCNEDFDKAAVLEEIGLIVEKAKKFLV